MSQTVTKTLDLKRLSCPLPIAKTAQAIRELQPGELIEALATDPGSVPDFLGWAKTSKLATLKEQRTEKDPTGREIYIHVLERRGAP